MNMFLRCIIAGIIMFIPGIMCYVKSFNNTPLTTKKVLIFVLGIILIVLGFSSILESFLFL